jgi:hypothetical protein
MYEKTDEQPITRMTLVKRRSYVVDAWREGGEMVQVWKDKAGRLYQGMADARANEAAWQPVVEVR